VLGERFSGADLLLVSMGPFSRAMLPAGDRVDAYLARAAARPALARALARDAG
jgi:glutathione S-transferase